MTEQLKPCPFCGGSAVVNNGPTYLWRVQCQECRIDGKIRPTKSEAIEAWNRRARPAQAGAEPVAFVHWPISGPPKLVWYSNKALDAAILKTHEGHQPDMLLYTHPPARVPLTDEEIAVIASTPCAVVGSYVHTFARAVIAAYEAKNGIGGGK